MELKTVLITGAASGLGLQLAKGLSAKGHKVFGTFRGAPPAGISTPITWLKADMLNLTAMDVLVNAVEQQAGRLDCVVCNAAVQGIGHMRDMTLPHWQEVLDVNLTAPFLLTQAAAPALKATSGLIVYISSVHGIRAAQDRTAYAVSKAGLNALARNVAADMASDGVRAISLVLGPFDSPALEQGSSRFFSDALGSEAIKKFAAEQPLGRVGTGRDLSDTIEFLMSEGAGFISGTEIVIDGGQSSRLNVPRLAEQGK